MGNPDPTAPPTPPPPGTHVAGTTPAESTPDPLLLPVKATSFTAPSFRGERAGRGTLEVAGGWLTLRLRQSGSLWGGRTVVRVPADGVLNVEHAGDQLVFEWDAGAKRRPRVVLRFATPADAARVAALLPTATTADFLPAVAEQQNFEAALRAAAPTVRATPVLVAANVLVFGLMVVVGRAGVLLPDRGTVLAWGGNHWPLTTGGQWWRLLTCTFLHFGVVHLALNMLALYGVGPLAERLYGRRFFAALYLAGGVFGSLASVWYNRPTTVGAGASGAVLAVYGLLLAYPLAQPGSVPRSVLRSLNKGTAAAVGYTLLFGLTQRFIDNAAHVGGLAAGFVLGVVCARPLDPVRRARQARPKAWAGGVVAVAAGVAALAYVPKCGWDLAAERRFLAEREALRAADDALTPAFDRLVVDAVGGRAAASEVDQALREQVLPVLDDIDTRLARCQLTATSPSRRLRDAWVRYAALRREAAAALVEADDAPTAPASWEAFRDLQDQVAVARREVGEAAKSAWAE
jgi:rhomboid protease GluP